MHYSIIFASKIEFSHTLVILIRILATQPKIVFLVLSLLLILLKCSCLQVELMYITQILYLVLVIVLTRRYVISIEPNRYVLRLQTESLSLLSGIEVLLITFFLIVLKPVSMSQVNFLSFLLLPAQYWFVPLQLFFQPIYFMFFVNIHPLFQIHILCNQPLFLFLPFVQILSDVVLLPQLRYPLLPQPLYLTLQFLFLVLKRSRHLLFYLWIYSAIIVLRPMVIIMPKKMLKIVSLVKTLMTIQSIMIKPILWMRFFNRSRCTIK